MPIINYWENSLLADNHEEEIFLKVLENSDLHYKGRMSKNDNLLSLIGLKDNLSSNYNIRL